MGRIGPGVDAWVSSWGEMTWSVARTLAVATRFAPCASGQVLFCWPYSVDHRNSIRYGIDPSLLTIGPNVKTIAWNKITSVSSINVALETPPLVLLYYGIQIATK